MFKCRLRFFWCINPTPVEEQGKMTHLFTCPKKPGLLVYPKLGIAAILLISRCAGDTGQGEALRSSNR